MKTIIINFAFVTLLATAVFFAGGCKQTKEETANETAKPIPVTVVTIPEEQVKMNITLSGHFTTDDETYLSFKTGGIVRSVFVKEGDQVKKGATLAILDLTEIQAMVKQAQTGYEKAERDFNRAKKLYADSVATLEQFENARSGFDFAKEQLAIAKHNLEYSEIKAPADGYILKRFVNEGQMTGPGTPVLQTNGAGKGNWMLRVSLSDKEWAIIKPGDNAVMTADIQSGTTLQGKVLRKSEAVDPYSGTFTADITVINKAATPLASGLFGKAVITPSQSVTARKIPFDAILDGDGNKGFMFVTRDNKTARKIPVKISAVTKEYILVTGGIDEGASIILSGSAYLTDGAAITITK